MRNIILAIFGCLFYSISLAQDIDSIWKNIDLDDVVITAQYAPTHSKNAVHQVKVLKAKDIQAQGLNNLAEVLSNQLNLVVSIDLILGNGLKIQGIGGENIQVMIDGVPVIGRTNGNIDLSQINMSNVERIEIIEGAMSAQYGSNASGGVINIITKKSQVNQFQIGSQNQYESIGIWNNSLSIGYQTGKLFASIEGNRFKSQFAPVDSFRIFETIVLNTGETYQTKKFPWNPKTQLGVNGTLRYRFSDSATVTYQYRFFDEILSSYGNIRRPQFRPYAFDEFFNTQRTDHSLTAEVYVTPQLYLNSTTAYNVYDRLKTTERLDIEPDTTSLVDGGQDTTTFTAFLHRSILSSVSNSIWDGQFGIEVLHETGFGQRILDSNAIDQNTALLTNYAAWVSVKFQPTDALVVQGNLRYGVNTKYDHPLIPSINISWTPQKDWNLKLSYANGFRAPSLKELHFNFVDINHYIIGNPNLKAEYAQNAALNLNYDKTFYDNHRLSISGKFFYNKIKNRIVLTEFEPARFNYQNVEEFETHGFNFQLNYSWNKQLTIKSGLALSRLYNDFVEDFDTDRFTNLYEMQNELIYQIPFIKTNLNLTHRYIGRQIRFYETDEGDLAEGFVGDYHLMNFSLSRHFWKKRIFLSVGSKNLLNIQTVPFQGSTSAAHSAVGTSQLLNWGRTYFVRLNLELGY